MNAVRGLSLIFASLTASGLLSAAGSDVISDTAPPPLHAERAPPPRDGYIWDAGHWELSGRSYSWVSGTWITERRGAHWIADRWDQIDNHWHFVPGHWER
jgi:hypothetical protein